MNNRLFQKWLAAVLIVCLAVTVLHLLYTVYAYQHCSIIYFIGKELW